MNQFEKQTNLDMEKQVVKYQQQAQIEHFNEEKKQKEMRRVQMAENINTSLKLRKDIDA